MAAPNGSRDSASLSPRRPSNAARHPTAPTVMTMNGHFAPVSNDAPTRDHFDHGIQVIDEDKEFNTRLPIYLSFTNLTPAGFNYHLISVFGSQSTGKSTLLNHLFGTDFGVMSEQERRQTTKGIWMAVNKREHADTKTGQKMADNILVMDVEGTDGRERGEDQDFERKAALFALATSEVLLVNMWEHQVGLYQGANMSLLKTVFEVNLELFIKGKESSPRSLLFFIIRDHIGATPLANLRETLMQDLQRIWASLSKPPGLEKSKIEDYFDFAFAALPHKILQPERFVEEVGKLGSRFHEAYRDPRKAALQRKQEWDGGVFLPEYHRRIPADGFSHYAHGVWDQIVNNKDLDLPTQQELLAQFRCDEISREVLIAFDEAIVPLENKQADGVRLGKLVVLASLGDTMRSARENTLKNFQTEASRYHKGVFARKSAELQGKIDGRLKTLFQGQLAAAHKDGVAHFSDAVVAAVKAGQRRGGSGGGYDFAEIVEKEKKSSVSQFEKDAKSSVIPGTPWSDYTSELKLFEKDLAEASGRLRGEELRRLATRVERWVKSRLGDAIGIEFNKLGQSRAGSSTQESGEKSSEKNLWDRVWNVFVDVVEEAEQRFADRAKGLDASEEEVKVGLWRLRRKSWGALKSKVEEEMMEGNLLLRLRENFEDKFRYDEAGVPRIWKPTDDIEGFYTKARESTLTLLPLLSRIRLLSTSSPPDLLEFIGAPPSSITPADEEDLVTIGGVDEEEGKSLEQETTILSESKRMDLSTRFKKMADAVYVEAKRSAIGGVAQVPLYFYGLLLALGWNEIWAVLRNPVYFTFLLLLIAAAYVTYTLNLWGPIARVLNAMSQQALEVAKERLREFLESSSAGREAIAMGGGADSISLDTLDDKGRRQNAQVDDDEHDIE